MDARVQGGSRSFPVEAGEWRGWFGSVGDPFNDRAGPFYHRREEDGAVLCAMRVEARHLNGGGMMHGGAIMTFADYCLYAFAASLHEGGAVTVSLHGDYVGAVPPGALLRCTGEIVRRTRSMVFLRGLMTVEGEPVFSFSGTLRQSRRADPVASRAVDS